MEEAGVTNQSSQPSSPDLQGFSCDEPDYRGLPSPCLLAWNPIQENTDLKYWFTVTLLMVNGGCKPAGEGCDGDCHWVTQSLLACS